MLLVLSHVKSGVLHLVHEPGVNSIPFLLQRFLSVIFDFRRGSSSETALSSRAMGGYVMTSDDPTLGSLTVFQSARVARLSSVCFALFLRLLAWKPHWPLATLIQSPSIGDVFIRDLAKVGSVGFVETAVEHVGLFFVAKRLVLRASASVHVQQSFFFNPPSGPWLTREDLCHVEFLGALEDARNWFVSSADAKDAFQRTCIPRSVFCTSSNSRWRCSLSSFYLS